MITPAYSSTATERVLPRMALDFTTEALDPRVTVARALDTATRINSSGLVEMISANLPRFDYTYGTGGACKGLLIEEQRTNTNTNSIFDGAVAGSPGTAPTGWTFNQITGSLSISTDNLGGNILSFTTSVAREVISRTFALLANTTYSFSVYLDDNIGNNTFLQLCNFASIPTGATQTAYVNGVLVTSSTYRPIKNDRLSIVVAVSSTAGNATVRIGCGVSNLATGTASFSKPQLEAGAFATSYIPTTTTSLTRNADAVSMTGTNFSDWYNANEGAFVVEALRYDNAARTAAAFDVDDGTAANYIQLASTATSGRGVIRVASGTAINLSAGSAAITTPAKLTIAYKNASFAFSSGGATPVTNSASAVPTVSQALIGSGINGSYLNGAVSKVMYWPQRLTNAEVQSFSK